MDPAILHHLLEPAERQRFDLDGFLVVPGALDTGTVERFGSIAAAHDTTFRAADGIGPHHVLNEHDLVGPEPDWLELVDHPTTFAKVFGILGWNIQLFHTQLLVTPPAPPGATPGPYGWHQDNNRMNRDLDTELHPMVSLKVGYFLTDLPAAGMGNLCVVPGSHRRAVDRNDESRPDGWRGSAGWPGPTAPEHTELTVAAGDAVIFDRRLWHSASTNTSSTTRVFLTFGYSYRWLRPKSAMEFGAALEAMEPVRRQLLGWATSANGYFDPLPDDVPLREWIRSNIGADAVAR